MILWTIRHSKPYNPNDVCYGRLDFDVSPTFPEESDGAIKALIEAGAKPTRLFTSPLLRCMRLAEKASEATGLPLEKRDEIIELNFGDWEGQKLTEVPREQMAAWVADLRGYRFPNGENFHDIDKRAQSLLDTLDDNGEFLWISHAGVIAALQHFACGLPDEVFVEGAFSYTMVTRFEFERDAEGHYRGTFIKIHDGIPMAPLKMK
ncbi:MAG: histidine phosphatase family protein [Fibrobacter sp.]|nr:histidine phosphatase family protein [Fibrobacter sp.]